MAKRKHVTPEELDAYLAADPEIALHIANRGQRHALLVARDAADAAPVVAALRGVGVYVSSLCGIPLRDEALRPDAVNILLSWLPRVKENNIKDAIIRGLIVAKEPFNGQPLVDCFMADSLEESLRFPIANTMAYAKVTGINDWLIEAVQVKRYGTARPMLAEAVAKHVPHERARGVLLKLLDDIPGPAAAGLARCGFFEDLQAIKARVDSATGWQKKEMEKAIRKIEKRLEKQSKRN